MKSYKTAITSLLVLCLLASVFNCSSIKKNCDKERQITMKDLDTKASFTLGNTYYQTWVAGVRGGGSGINLFLTLPTNKNNVVLDSVYFRKMQSKLEPSNKGYVASFKTVANQPDDIIMSNDKNAEFGNEMPKKKKFPFDLKDNDCVVSYIEDNKTKYLLLKNVTEKERMRYPSAPPKR